MRHHRFNPVRDLFTLQDRMNRLFEEAAERRPRTGGDEIERADWVPAADVYEDEREYTLALDLPGIDRGALEVNLDDGRLVVRGTRAAAEGGSITADYKDGVLFLHLPKRGEQQRQQGRVKIDIG